MSSTELEQLRGQLAAYDSQQLLASLGGLLLLPSNGHHWIRLVALAHLGASLPIGVDKPEMTRGRLQQVLTSAPLTSHFEHLEDPFGDPWTESVTFHGGSYTLLSGYGYESTYIVRRLADAIFRIPGAELSSQFRATSLKLFMFALGASDLITSRAGMKRSVPTPHQTDSIELPFGTRLREMASAVNLTANDLASLGINTPAEHKLVGALMVDAGGVPADDLQSLRSVLEIRPFVRFGEEVVLAAPGAVGQSLTNAILREAAVTNVISGVADRFADSVWLSVQHSLRLLGNYPVSWGLPECPVPGTRSGLFGLDSDKVLYVASVADRLIEFDPDAVPGDWSAQEVLAEVAAHFREVEALVLGAESPPNEIVFLAAVQSTGREHLLTIARDKEPMASRWLPMSAADLEVIAQTAPGEPLLLWRFVSALWDETRGARLVSWSMLDKFATWHENDRSFYFGDDGLPTMVMLPSDSGSRLRAKAVVKRDTHGQRDASGGVSEVALRYEAPDVPIYVNADALSRAPEMVVEAWPVPVCVVTRQLEGTTEEQAGLLFDVVDAVAYWVWQLAPVLRGALDWDALQGTPVALEVTVESLPNWAQMSQVAASDEAPFTAQFEPSSGKMSLTFNPSARSLFASSDNRAERALVGEMFRALRDSVGLRPEQDIAAAVDEVAPTGQKRKLLMFEGDRLGYLDPRGLAASEGVSESDVASILDEVGDAVAQRCSLKVGDVPPDQQVAALNEAVSWMFDQLAGLVRTLDPIGLLEWLIRNNEALTRDYHQRLVTLPTEIACFQDSLLTRDSLGHLLSQRSGAMIASRFLIEYVTAQPPAGFRPMNWAVYHRMLALAYLIESHGYESDLLHHQLVPPSLELLPSGRLGRETSHRASMKMFEQVRAHGEVVRVSEGFPNLWRAPIHEPPDVTELEEAVEGELGVKLSMVIDFLEAIRSIGMPVDPVVPAMPLPVLRGSLESRFGFTQDQVDLMFNLFMLQPREDFLTPPAPFKQSDVFPWVFGRELSYVRRPLSLREGQGGPEVIWGPRHLAMAGRVLVNQFTGGRIRPRSKALASFLAKTRSTASRAFEDRVGNAVERRLGGLVRVRFKKLSGGPRLPPELGDIDLLQVDARRRRLVVGESKDLDAARTARELANEVETMFRGHGETPSTVERLLARAQWCGDNLDAILAALAINPRGKWKVMPVVIVSHELVSPFLESSVVPVIPLATIEDLGHPCPGLK